MKCKKYVVTLAGIVMLCNSSSLLAMEKKQALLQRIRGIRAQIRRNQINMRKATKLADVSKRYKSATLWLSNYTKGKIPQANFDKFSNDLKETYGQAAKNLIRNYPKKWMRLLNNLKETAEQKGSEKVISLTNFLEKKVEPFLADINQLTADGIIPKEEMSTFARNFNHQATREMKKMRTFIKQLQNKEKKHPKPLEATILKKLVKKYPSITKKTEKKEKTQAEQPEIYLLLLNIKQNLIQAGHMLYDKQPHYDGGSINRLGTAIANLEKSLDIMQKKLPEDLTKGLKAAQKDARAWHAGLKNIIRTTKKWHFLFSGERQNNPDFKARETSLIKAQKYGGVWYDKMKLTIQRLQKKAAVFEKMESVPKKQYKTLQSIYAVMLSLLDGVYYSVGAPAGGIHRIGRYVGLYKWPAFKLKKRGKQ